MGISDPGGSEVEYPSELDGLDEYDERRRPTFHLPDISPASFPPNLPEYLRNKYAHVEMCYKLLWDIWCVQLRLPAARNCWNIKAAHDFWCEAGPKTFDGRQYGWSETWIPDALTSLLNQINSMRDVATREPARKERMQKLGKDVLNNLNYAVSEDKPLTDDEMKMALDVARANIKHGHHLSDEDALRTRVNQDVIKRTQRQGLGSQMDLDGGVPMGEKGNGRELPRQVKRDNEMAKTQELAKGEQNARRFTGSISDILNPSSSFLPPPSTGSGIYPPHPTPYEPKKDENISGQNESSNRRAA
ncbi:hypothetical protein FQN50_007729 [Emmonsiellopsis sp. PD_5]|nr:hypothetical protein FQN50_007729 [Emmonsiellopsis sp. PD_5]